jgi:hypothetical protein
VVPQLSSAADAPRERDAKIAIYRVRQQLELYKQQHEGCWPSLAGFAEQMTRPTNARGEVLGDSAARGRADAERQGALGPYLPRVPDNPFTRSNSVTDGEPGASAWYYDPSTGEFRANHVGYARGW